MYQLLTLILLIFVSPLQAMSSHISSKSVDKAIALYSLKKEPELISMFKRAKVQYPPKQIALLAFKKEQHIELWAKDKSDAWKFIHTYPLTAFSGNLGPKLKERDGQIPEGIYRLTMFNPYSTMHLSIMIDYPNGFDRAQAFSDGRKNLGGDIFLHGKDKSVGCLAVGDRAIEQLFLLVRRVGLNNTQVIIAPNDLRLARPATDIITQPKWLPKLYQKINLALSKFPAQNKKHFF
jgi:murein L,D-transpeptidase YafK